MDIKHILVSRKSQKIVVAFLCLAVAFFIFELGVTAGYRRAQFSAQFGDRYAREFGGPRMDARELPGGHGAVGKVVSVHGDTVTVATPDNLEAIVHISPLTMIRSARDAATTTDIVVGEGVVVLGSPNQQGEIDARLIRLLP